MFGAHRVKGSQMFVNSCFIFHFSFFPRVCWEQNRWTLAGGLCFHRDQQGLCGAANNTAILPTITNICCLCRDTPLELMWGQRSRGTNELLLGDLSGQLQIISWTHLHISYVGEYEFDIQV